MSVTKIWTLNSSVKAAYDYISQEHKTVESVTMDISQAQLYEAQMVNQLAGDHIGSALGYISKDIKTNKKQYVTGILCSPETAIDEFLNVKKKYKKTSGAVGYHCIQSFMPGEIDPEMAHAIGVETAEYLWGRHGYQVVVATHIDRNHLHNHFVINSVNSFDGSKNPIRYHKTISSVSDSIVKKHGYSVVLEPGKNPGKQPRLSKRQIEIKNVIDTAIADARDFKDFVSILQFKGYEFNYNANRTYWTIKHESWNRPLRLIRLGDDYSNSRLLERIERELPLNVSNNMSAKDEFMLLDQYRRINSNWKNTPQYKYFIAMYRLGVKLPPVKRPQINQKEVRIMQRNIKKIEYLNQCREQHIDISQRINIIELKIDFLKERRKEYVNQIRRYRRNGYSYIDEQGKLDSINNELNELNKEKALISEISTEYNDSFIQSEEIDTEFNLDEI